MYQQQLMIVVEATGVEPVSENPSERLSTGVSGSLISPAHPKPAKNARGSLFIHDRYTDRLTVHVHRLVTPEPKPRYSSEGRAALRRRELIYYC